MLKHPTPPMADMLSVVVPVYNEVDSLPHFAARLRPILDRLPVPYEVLCVDDGSKDGSDALLRDSADEWPQLTILRLRRNAGHQAALTAGLDHARGDWIVSIDADLQDPPEAIAPMLAAAMEQRVDVVYGVRSDRTSDSRFKRGTAGLYYRAMRRAAGVEIPHHAGDFRLLSRRALTEVQALPERGRVYRLLVPYMGFSSAQVSYHRAGRVAGTSKYPLHRMVRLAAESYTSFTTAPLRLATWLGLLGCVLCSSFAIGALIGYFLGANLPGWTSVAIVLGFIGALQFLFLGLIGEYLARLYTEVQGRPRYFVDRDSEADRAACPHWGEPNHMDAPPSGRGLDPLSRSQY